MSFIQICTLIPSINRFTCNYYHFSEVVTQVQKTQRVLDS